MTVSIFNSVVKTVCVGTLGFTRISRVGGPKEFLTFSYRRRFLVN